MASDPIPSWYSVLVVVRLGPRFLVVHERRHGQLWYLPAGRVEPGETFQTAASRETIEEAGIPIVLDGVLRVEHTPGALGSGARMRVTFLAHPADDTQPKSTPDEASLGAAWVTLSELTRLPVRGREVHEIFDAVARGATVYPLALLRAEGDPWLPPPRGW